MIPKNEDKTEIKIENEMKIRKPPYQYLSDLYYDLPGKKFYQTFEENHVHFEDIIHRMNSALEEALLTF